MNSKNNNKKKRMQMAENKGSRSETNVKVLPILVNRIQSWFTN